MHTKFKEIKVSRATSGSFAEKSLFCKTYVLYNICSMAKIHEKYLRSSSFLSKLYTGAL